MIFLIFEHHQLATEKGVGRVQCRKIKMFFEKQFSWGWILDVRGSEASEAEEKVF